MVVVYSKNEGPIVQYEVDIIEVHMPINIDWRADENEYPLNAFWKYVFCHALGVRRVVTAEN